MDHTLTTPGTEQITELWGSIPINLRASNSQSPASETEIEYWDGSVWQQMSTSLVGTQYVRLGRDWGSGPAYVYLDFGEAQDIKLSSQIFDQSAVSGPSQGSARNRNIHVDLHGNPGTSRLIPSERVFQYSIITEEPPLNGEDPPEDEGAMQELSLNEGWNLVSSYVQPDEPALENVFASVIEEIAVVKDVDGNVFIPELNINELGEWNSDKAYYVFSSEEVSFTMSGALASNDVLVEEGWFLVPFHSESVMGVEDAFSSLMENLIMVKGENGDIFYPNENVDLLIEIEPGRGYAIFVSQESNLIIE
jgi:hypothetical protein